ncbi:hypothetical protein BASA81_003546 [Batrachochytrium salamandrivorans]|nr:hypothetical protein BASA81_003546 [Batrachochytrium salamandrivorans]
MSPAVPAWFAASLAAPCESVFVEVEPGINIHCLRWGRSDPSQPKKRGLVFVHGGGANAEWFRFIAPFFSKEFDCVAISNSGCGDSSCRPHKYDLDSWSEEVLACCEQLGLEGGDGLKPYLVAHSLGSFVVTNLLSRLRAASKFAGVVLCDGAIRSYKSARALHDHMIAQQPHRPPPRTGWARNPTTITPLSRFKLRPLQPCENEYILNFLAESNTRLVAEETCWEWKGDFNRDAKVDWSSFPVLTNEHVSQIARAGVQVCWVYGQDSLLCDSKVAAFVRRELGNEIGIVGMPCAAHHLWLDQPLAFVGVLQGLFAGWALSHESSKL